MIDVNLKKFTNVVFSTHSILRVQRAFALSMSEAEVRSALGSVKLSVSCIPKNLGFSNYFLENPMKVFELP